MSPTQVPDHDKDYILLKEIDDNSELTQRELSHRTGLSLGSVNWLIQKMIREGLIKMETIPANRVIYILTPQGMAEKASKAVQYIRHHYNAIQSTKDRIRRKLDRLCVEYQQIICCLPDGELRGLVEMTVGEYLRERSGVQIRMVESRELGSIEDGSKGTIVLFLPDDQAQLAYESVYHPFETDLLI